MWSFYLATFLISSTRHFNACEAWVNTQSKVQMKRIISIGSPQLQDSVPDTLVFHRRIEKDELTRTRVQNFAFEFNGAGPTTTAIGGSKASAEYVQVELMNDNFPQADDFLLEEAMKYSNSEEQLSQAHKIQQAYREWCDYYGKAPNKDRLGVFAANFLAVKDFHERTGKPLIMNEYSDLTEEEWKLLQQQQKSQSGGAKESPPLSVDDPKTMEQQELIHKAYWEWCHYYGKTYDEKRLKTFANNFLAVQKYHRQTNKELMLNEFADMSELEYQNYLKTTAHFVSSSNVISEMEVYTVTSPVQRQQEDPITTALPTPPLGQQQLEFTQNSSKSDTDFTIHEIVSALQSAVDSLSEVVRSMNQSQGPLVSPPSKSQEKTSSEQPLDALVIDVLKKQDNDIAELHDSLDGVRDIQEQSGELIQLVSQNQMQMAEMMNAIQTEMELMQQELKQSREEKSSLINRVRNLENVLENMGLGDLVASNLWSSRRTEAKTPKVSPATSALAKELKSDRSGKIVIEPNPIGLGMTMFAPPKSGASAESYSMPLSTSKTLENRRRTT
ncbi:cathepsin propeptide inhibitor domain I29 [Nitzschia inconspicua]|uniref:Cathepsin propeptide inhibitor domain I29 n=1 Tax=Nitzschia inconspicua TaxID=303405 RepID=A0A9K3L4B5_9STRA|nr:cathepsin propeptide inhibitor domain I29 [Nitzschia inconspicua]